MPGFLYHILADCFEEIFSFALRNFQALSIFHDQIISIVTLKFLYSVHINQQRVMNAEKMLRA